MACRFGNPFGTVCCFECKKNVKIDVKVCQKNLKNVSIILMENMRNV